MMGNVEFAEELERVLPPEIPHRNTLIEKGARHLELILAANEYMNLTRILSPREAAIKHVYDSVAPWRAFRNARTVLDAGTGAGFPGVPLSVVLPEAQFLLAESIGKKARFVEGAVESLRLPNVHVVVDRAERVAASRHADVITARAVAPLDRLLNLFGKALKKGSRLILYKGPDVEAELQEARKHAVRAEIISRYELPDDLGARTLLEIQSVTARARTA
jgi:16S rRNA (guanine527-N7)-methyltransferase